jgi:hypothetical protein
MRMYVEMNLHNPWLYEIDRCSRVERWTGPYWTEMRGCKGPAFASRLQKKEASPRSGM